MKWNNKKKTTKKRNKRIEHTRTQSVLKRIMKKETTETIHNPSGTTKN